MTAMDERTIDTGGARPPSLVRLTTVELRKLVDTRSGLWLLVVILLSCVVIAVVQLIVVDPAAHTHGEFFIPTLLPVGILLPVLGILLVTSEWSQRTALTTFTLVPLRHRVLAAKLAAGSVAAVLSVAAGLALGALANLLGMALGGAGDWNVNATAVGNAVLFQLINVIMGVAFGMLLLNTPLAIVTFFLLPMVWTILGEMISGLRTAAGWLDLAVTTEILVGPVAPDAGQWARIGTSVAVWVLLPLALGVVRVLRTEVK